MRARRSLEPIPDGGPLPAPPADPIPPLLSRLLAEHAATGLPAAYLPKDELSTDEDPDDSYRKLLATYGLKFNPFLPSIPVDDILSPRGTESFFFRAETLVMDGGFGMITGDPGLGKSKLLQLLGVRLSQIDGVVVGVYEHPTSSLGDFYRELGHLFGLKLSVANRYGSFSALRDRWRQHIQATLFRPVLLVDEAQEVASSVLNELRILGSERFDSENLLTVVLAGDERLPNRFRQADLVPFGTRIRVRLPLTAWSSADLGDMLEHLLARAGNPGLLTPGLRSALVDHAAGNPRLLTTLAAELLDIGLQRNRPVLDEALFLETFDRTPKKPRAR